MSADSRLEVGLRVEAAWAAEAIRRAERGLTFWNWYRQTKGAR